MTPTRPRRLDGIRVAVLNWRDPWQATAGGAEVFAYEISRGLAGAGASVDFLTSRGAGQARCETRDEIRWLRGGGRWTVYPAVLARLLIARVLGRDYDVVLDCQNGIPFFAPLVVPRRRTSVVIVVHHVHDEQFGVHFPRPIAALGRWLEGPAARRVYQRSTAVAVSPSTVAAMRTRLRWRGPIELVFNGVHQPSETAVHASVRSCTPRVVVVGRLVRHKRLERVVGLVAELGTVWPGLEVHVIGRGPHAPRGRSGVHVHGYLEQEEMDALLRTAWLHVSASQGEGWGLSVLEAAAQGIPTVAYDVDGLRDAIRDGETGWLVADGESLADAVSRALGEIDGDPARAVEVRDACVVWAWRFPWERSVQRMVDVILAQHDDAVRGEELAQAGEADDPVCPPRVVARKH